ncbi:MAG: ATPase, T2SS/T4P/T4SS family, partial [Candidatus Omnitrophota bacterium]|nr:ATPase, T2SS/T4P/T4SS family [Candidatus Omnitrophota bacterium]
MGFLKKHIVELLVQHGLLTAEQLEEITGIQKEKGASFSSLLMGKNIIQREALNDFIRKNAALPRVDSASLIINPEIITVLSGDTARKYRLLPLSKDGQLLKIAIAEPSTILDLEEIKELQGYTVNPVLGPEGELTALIERNYSSSLRYDAKSQTMEAILSSVAELSSRAKDDLAKSDVAHMAQEVPIIRATNFILEKAIELKSSDILIEPMEKMMRIRMRIDGMLHQIETLPLSFHSFIVSRIKVISNLDIAEHRLPQDGQFKIKLKNNREVEFRVSVIASTTGEKVAIRVLDKSLDLLDIDRLGLRPEALEKLKKAALMPNGMILVCGPTGSGKTTTLYSILKYIHTPEKNIVTVEDPVEYQIKGINQVPVNPKTGLVFSRCLRSILRQDPDIIMIGEIRDFETMDIAIKAALTGHLVLSTLHTTTAAGSIVRLLDMGVQPFLINASVLAIISQRLARRICPICREKTAG